MKLFYICLFILIVNTPAFCYIDPGTGSMLITGIIALISTIFFFLKRFYFVIKAFLFKLFRNEVIEKKVYSIVMYSEGRNYWNVFKPVIDILDARKVEFDYFTSDKEDPVFSYKIANNKAQYIGEKAQAYNFLNNLKADVCLMTTPGLDVLYIKKTKKIKHYCHIIHSMDISFYKLFSLDYYDSVLVSGKMQEESIRELEKVRNLKQKEIRIVGCTYLDVLREKKASLRFEKNEKRTILISPSWGSNSLLTKYGMKLLSPFIGSDFDVIIRPHPQSRISEKKILSDLMRNTESISHFYWDFEVENLISLSKADIMISDYSGIIFDFAFLFDKPIILPPLKKFDKRGYDASDLQEDPWNLKILKDISISFDDDDLEVLPDMITEILLKNAKSNSDVIKDAYYMPGSAGLNATNFLIEKSEMLKKNNERKN